MAQSEKDARKPGRLAAIASEFAMSDLEEEMDAATPEEREKILEREGWTRDEMRAVRARTRAKLKAKLAELEKAAEPPAETPAVKPASTPAPPPDRSNVVDLNTWRRRVVRFAATSSVTAAALAAAFYGVYLPATNQHIADIKPVATAAGAGPGNWDLSDPFVMRHEGMSHCAYGDYAECLVWLDRAYAKDPGGEQAWPRIQEVRKRAVDALAAQRDH
jgi:hypothetical protein